MEVKTDTERITKHIMDRKRCSSYDEDCHKMSFVAALCCYTDYSNILKGGPADGYCPILEL